MTPYAPGFAQTRRTVLAAMAAAAVAGGAQAAARPRIITLLGDSITAGYGLRAADALPARLQDSLRNRGLNVVVRAAGVSGDTSTDALARVDFSVQNDTDLCLVELGGNDLLQGVDPGQTRASLLGIVRRLKARRIPVMLAGMMAPPMICAAYAREFDAVFGAVAKTQHVPLYPFLLAGVAGVAGLNQKDRIHPNPAGVKIIADRLAPAVAKALGGRS